MTRERSQGTQEGKAQTCPIQGIAANDIAHTHRSSLLFTTFSWAERIPVDTLGGDLLPPTPL
jgi:hypothetical protein